MTIWPTSGLTITAYNLAMSLTQAALVVTIVAPASGSSQVTAAVPVSWSFAPGTQATFRVRVYYPGTGALVYDSGVISSSANNHTIPVGSLEGDITGYTLTVDITTTNGNSGSGSVTFNTAWATSVDITGLTVVGEGDKCDLLPNYPVIPRAVLRWDQVVPGVSEVFTRYSVYRRIPSVDTTWTRIASITDITTTRYYDYTGAAYTTYEYAVTWSGTNGVNEVESVLQSPPPQVTIEFDWTFIHNVDDPTQWVAYYALEMREPLVMDRTTQRIWGRTLPTMFIGDDQHYEVEITGLPDVHRGQVWDDLITLIDSEREDAITLCLRIGVGGTSRFCNVQSANKDDGQAQYVPHVTLVETYYTDAVA